MTETMSLPRGLVGGSISSGTIELSIPGFEDDQSTFFLGGGIMGDSAGGGTGPKLQLLIGGAIVVTEVAIVAGTPVMLDLKGVPLTFPVGVQLTLRALKGSANFTAGTLFITFAVGGI